MADSWICPVIGIDMGERHSSVGIWQHGRVEIIMNDQGNRKIPCCVAFTEKECLIGDAAKNQMATNPENTIFGINRLIAKKYSDARFQNEVKNWPFKVVADADDKDKPKIVVTYLGEEKQFTAEEIYSMVLMEMKKTAEAYLGAKVKHAVITVPPYFYENHRKATIEAGGMAGLNVIKVIKEPRAAVIAYAFHKKFTVNNLDNYNVLIFNLGGGNLDVTLLTVTGNVITFKGVNGHYKFGGDDFDKRMASNFVEEYKSSYGHGQGPFDDPKGYQVLVAACERAKRRLSIHAETQLDFDLEGTHFSTTISRTKFEVLNKNLFKKCLCIVDNVLGAAKMKESNINRVILAGGSTRIPKVRQMLHEVFPEAELCCGIVDEVYAYGGAIHAAMSSDVDIPRVVPSSEHPHGAAAEERLLLPSAEERLLLPSAEERLLLPCKKRRRDLETNGEEVEAVEPSIILQDIEALLKDLSNLEAINNNDVTPIAFPKDQFMKLLEEIRCKPNDLKLSRKVPQMLKNLYPLLPKILVGVMKSLEKSLLFSQQKFMKWSSKEDAIPVKLGDADAIESSLINIKTQIVHKTCSRDQLKSNIAGIEMEIAKLEERKAQLKEDLEFAEQDLIKVTCSMGPQLELAKLQSAQLVQLREATTQKAEAKDSMESTLHLFANSFMKM